MVGAVGAAETTPSSSNSRRVAGAKEVAAATETGVAATEGEEAGLLGGAKVAVATTDLAP